MVSLRIFLSTTLVATLTLTSILPLGLMAATPPTPAGFNTGGIFADYFKNAVENPCPANQYMVGLKMTPANYMKPDCLGQSYIDSWNVVGNNIVDNAKFLGTTNNQPLRFRTNNIEKMYIGTDGKVGIGTNAPQAVLDVSGGDTKLGDVFGGVAGGTRAIWKYDNAFPNYGIFYTEGTPDVLSLSPSGGGIGSPDMTIRNGNIGIGVVSPATPLDIRSPIDALINLTQPDPADGWNYMQFNSNAGRRWWVGTDATGIFTIMRDTSAATYARIGNAGLTVDNNLGIGYSTAAYPLDVNGTIRANGEMIRTGGWRLTTAWGPDVLTLKKNAWNGVANDNYGDIAAGHGYYYGGLQSGGATGWEASNYGELYVASKSMLMGNVGIGTATPASKLTLKQPGSGWDDGMSFVNPGGATIFKILSDNNAQYLTIAAGNDYAKSITLFANTGNVGIGTNAPGAKLDVNGGILATTIRGTLQAIPAPRFDTSFYVLQSQHWYSHAGNDTMYIGEAGNTTNIRGKLGVGTAVPAAALAVDTSGLIGGANQSFYDIGAGHIAAGNSIYSYGAICSLNNSGDCSGANGVVIGTPNATAYSNFPAAGASFVGGDLTIRGNIRLSPATAQPNRVLTALDNLGNAEWRAPAAAPAAFALTNDTWLQSTPDNANRLYYANGGGTLFGSPNGIYGWRNSTNALNNMILDDGGNLSINGNMTVPGTTRSRVFFDHDDTTYYVDPNGESRVRSIRSLVGDAAVSGPRWDTSFHVLEAGYWYAHNGAQTMYIGESNPVIVRGDIRSPIFYDLDNPAYNIDPTLASQINTIYARNGFRAQGDSGFYFEDHGGGFQMIDNTWIRTFGNKSIYQNTGIMRTDGTFQVGGGGSTFNVVENGNLSYRTNVFFANTAGNVGIGTDTPGAKLEVAGQLKITGGVPGPGKILTSDATGLASWSNPASGMPAAGLAGQTLYSNGVSWLASSNIFNNNGDVGIGTNAPGAKLDVTSNIAEVANFSSTTPNAYINLYGAGTRKAYISATGSDLSIMNIGNGSLTFGTNGFKSMFITPTGLGIGVDIPTESLDIDGGVRIRSGGGAGKVLTSDADGVATWQPLPASGGGGGGANNGIPPGYVERDWQLDEDNYGAWVLGNLADTCPGGSDAAFTCDKSSSITCRDKEAVPATGCGMDSYGIFSCATWGYTQYRDVTCVQATLLVKIGNSCSANIPACGNDARCSLTQGVPAVNNQGWVQNAAACGYSCINGYVGANCEIPPCETVGEVGAYPACGGKVPLSPINPVYDELWTVSRPLNGNPRYIVLFCKSGVDAAAKNLYMNTRAPLFDRKSNPPVPSPFIAHYGGYFQKIGAQWYEGDDAVCPPWTPPESGGG